MNTAPLVLAPRRRLRPGAMMTVPVLIVTGLATLSAASAAAAPIAPIAIDLPPGAEAFTVSQTDEGTSDAPFLTSDGQRVFFASTATDLVLGDDNGVADIFVSVAAQGEDDPYTGRATLVSAPDGPVGSARANGASGEPVASADGRYVAFTSTATNLTADPAQAGRRYIFVRDLVAERTFRVQGAEAPDADSYDPDLSDDGRYLVFTTTARTFTDMGPDDNPDVVVADLDANGDGSLGDMSFGRLSDDVPITGINVSPQISGNGRYIYFLSSINGIWAVGDPIPTPDADDLYRVERGRGGGEMVFSGVREPSVDATGHVVAYVSTVCGGDPVVLASAYDQGFFTVAIGWLNVRRSVGDVSAPSISADGNTVAWSTTQPRFDMSDPAQGALAVPVIRVESPAWWDAPNSVECTGVTTREWTDVAEGTSPSLSAAGRSVAFSGESTERPDAAASVVIVDRHTHDGIAVSTVQGEVVDAGFMIGADIREVPITTLRDYAGALANAPIHRLPIHRLPIHRLPIHRLPIHRLLVEDAPIHRLPIHRLPIHRLPIHRLDIPGGWAELLADTPFGADLLQSVTLDEVLDWAADNLGSADDTISRAAERIRSLSLADVDLDGSGIDALSVASLVLGSVPVVELDIPGDGDNEARWQALMDAQGLDVDVDAETVLAELDAAGLDIGRSGVDTVPLRSIPIAQTLFGEVRVVGTPDDPGLFLAGTPIGGLTIDSLDASTQDAVFDGTPSGSIENNLGAVSANATLADLSVGVPAGVSFGDLLFSLFDVDSYPWEQIDPFDMTEASLGTSPGECTSQLRCVQMVNFRFAFDPGPGEPTTFAAPTATITLPPETRPAVITAAATGPGLLSLSDYSSYGGTTQRDGTVVRVPLNDTAGGTMYSFTVDYPVSTTLTDGAATGELTTGDLSASASLSAGRSVPNMDDPTNERRNGEWFDVFRPGRVLEEGAIYYEWISPLSKSIDDEGNLVPSPAADEDWFRITPPTAGQRLIVSTNANDGQIAMALYRQGAPVAPLGTTDAGAAPGTPVTDATGDVGQAAAGADVAPPLEGHSLVDQVSLGGDGVAQIEAASTDGVNGEMLLRVSSGNGQPSSSLYSVRVRYLDEPTDVVCPGWEPASPDVVTGISDPIDADTNTIFVIDTARFAATNGAAATSEVLTAIAALEGTGAAGSEVHPAVISVDTDPAVAAARGTLDENPCSMSAREDLVTAINAHVAEAIAGHESTITSVVLVGGDDIVPFAPVAQQTAQFNEAGRAADLRLAAPLAGGDCPETVAEGALDACATPLSAAAATNHILTDDPYGLADAYETLGGHLYVPTVGVGRLVDTPAQITAALGRFVATDGVLEADSTLTGGYGAWSELPDVVTTALDWRSDADQQLTGIWNRPTTEAALFPDGGETARVVSINTHADERRMIPGISGAENGVFAPGDLLDASGRANAPQLEDALVFLIGCHAGNNLPASYYGADATDWVDVFSTAGGFVGNTGFGLANSVSTALSERLLALYADWIGVTADTGAVTTAGALTLAKQSYLGQLGLYSGYDEKVLMEAVYYGLPMYTLSPVGDPKEAPLPQIPADLQPVGPGTEGVLSASLTLTPDLSVATDAEGNPLDYLVAGGEAPAVVPGQPVLPKIVARLGEAPAGTTPRGALITALTSQIEEGIDTPAVSSPSVGVPETNATRTDVAFPSSYATVTRQQTSEGPIDLLVVTPARVTVGHDGRGVVEKFTGLTVEATYGSGDDTTAPTIQSVELPLPGGTEMRIRATDVQSQIAAMVLLVQRGSSTTWERVDVTPPATGDEWTATVPEEEFRWILQVVDAAGNVATDTARGRLAPAAASHPTIVATGGDETVEVGSRLVRTMEVTDVSADELLTATFTMTRADGGTEASGVAPVATGPDGRTRVTIDHVVKSPGSFTVRLEVCSGASCSPGEFALTVPYPNNAPSSTVAIQSSTTPVRPDAVLTAVGTATDPDEGDTATLTYAWWINGVPARTGSQLALDGLVNAGDIVTVWAIPSDGKVTGHQSKADVRVEPAPAAPSITLTARVDGGGDYTEGTWSRTAVSVTFMCDSGVSVTSCSPSEVVSDTAADGYTVVGHVLDELGRSASVSILVKVDGRAPTLAPTVTPATVAVGGSAVAAPHATDAGSGVASASCAAPNTATAGAKTVTCTATDVAGNTATATAAYTVTAPAPRQCLGVADRTPLLALNPDGSSVFLRTSAVPIVFRACDASGRSIGTKGFVKSVTLVSTTSLPASAKINEAWYLPLGGFTYLSASKTWIGHIPTAKLARGKKYTYRVSLADGTSFTVTFGVR